MHRALYLEEILLNIFGYCVPIYLLRALRWSSHGTTDLLTTATLAALARTCRRFKEPALDVLWMELVDLTPLLRCLPDASCAVETGRGDRDPKCYLFSRDLTKAEWDTLRSYTHRVWRIVDGSSQHGWLDPNSIHIISNPPDPKPLFPNLRYLRWKDSTLLPLLPHLASSHLMSLDLGNRFSDVPELRDILPSLCGLFPRVSNISVHFDPMDHPRIDLSGTISRQILCWNRLHTVFCLNITLDMNVILHLSRMPALRELAFTLSPGSPDQPTPFEAPLIFAKLQIFMIKSDSLYPITWFLTRARLPMVFRLTTWFRSPPSKSTLKSCMIAARNACTPHRIEYLIFRQTWFSDPMPGDPEQYRLAVEDLRPCMAFYNLRCLDTSLQLSVELADRDLLELTSAWPNLDQLLINDECGWRTEDGGITPGGLLQVLEQCQKLRTFCLVIDTRECQRQCLGVQEIPHCHVGPLLRAQARINIVDSAILPEAVPSLGRFFGDLPLRSDVQFDFWNSFTLKERADSEVPRRLWREVYDLAKARIREKEIESRGGQ